MTKFDQRYPSARTGSGKASWPRGVHKISQIGLDNIGVDEEGRLYWNGQMVKEANPLELTYPQEVSAIIAVASGVVLALSTLALAVVDAARSLGVWPLPVSATPTPAAWLLDRASFSSPRSPRVMRGSSSGALRLIILKLRVLMNEIKPRSFRPVSDRLTVSTDRAR